MAANLTNVEFLGSAIGLSVEQSLPAGDFREVPRQLETRKSITIECVEQLESLQISTGPSREVLETSACRVLQKLSLPLDYLGWTMVVLANEYWRERLRAVPLERRLLLLPDLAVQNKKLGNVLARLRSRAEDAGLKILVAESSAEVMQVLLDKSIEAIIGVASLDKLEKCLDLILLSGIPALAIPIHEKSMGEVFDFEWVEELFQRQDSNCQTPNLDYAALLRRARAMFEPSELMRLVPRLRRGPSLAEVNGAGKMALEPIAATETIAHDFLALGGKYARPFITLAAYHVMSHRETAAGNGSLGFEEIPDAVRRVALSIEIFHKASLVHDDIEDADDFRYGRPALHRAHGLPTAINVGDYLIGLGYSLVSRETAALGGDVVGDIVDILADAHLRLSEGQGAELLWRDTRNKSLTIQDALEIYALKTSPAFEAALLCGLRCAEPLGENHAKLREFCQYLGIAFQILNDLKDWQEDKDNKLQAGLDTLGGRPTVLWALALESLPENQRQQLLKLIDPSLPDGHRIEQVRQLYIQAHVFAKAEELVALHRSRARAIAEQIAPTRLQHLLRYLVETVLFGASKITSLSES